MSRPECPCRQIYEKGRRRAAARETGGRSADAMKRISLEKRSKIAGYLFALPFIVGFCVFMLYPLLLNLKLSLGERIGTVGFNTKFVGFKNYIDLFSSDVKFAPAFLETMKQTFLWTPFIIVFALFIAIILNRNLKGKGFFRVIFFLPVLLGTGYVMQHVGGAATVLALPESVNEFVSVSFSPGLADFINNLLQEVLSNIWLTSVQIVIFLSGLQGISETYYEASRIDGANALEQFWKITLPLLSPVILLNIVYTIIESFRSTDNAIADLIVKTAFGEDPRYEYGAAMGYVYFLVVLLVVGAVFLISRKMVNYEK